MHRVMTLIKFRFLITGEYHYITNIYKSSEIAKIPKNKHFDTFGHSSFSLPQKRSHMEFKHLATQLMGVSTVLLPYLSNYFAQLRIIEASYPFQYLCRTATWNCPHEIWIPLRLLAFKFDRLIKRRLFLVENGNGEFWKWCINFGIK